MTFRKSTIDQVDRVVVLRINIEEGEASIEEFADGPASEIVRRCVDTGSELRLSVRNRSTETVDLDGLRMVSQASVGDRTVKQYENGTIAVEIGGVRVPTTKPELRAIAAPIGVPLLNGSGGNKNTRQLGSDIIAALQALAASVGGPSR